ncbi:MAG: hypothetical protein JSU63_11775 [Phycisphaerales bacterium]|nr:MAG: hypothetical protein JSU63_11775 [Phycisphaerales bacterium]
MIRRFFIVVLTISASMVLLGAWFTMSRRVTCEIRRTPQSSVLLCVSCGSVAIIWMSCDDPQILDSWVSDWKPATVPTPLYYPNIAFKLDRYKWFDQRSGMSSHGIAAVTLAAPFGILVACPTIAFIRGPLRRRRRRRKGLCIVCGYDLTGNVSGKCPECGTEV